MPRPRTCLYLDSSSQVSVTFPSISTASNGGEVAQADVGLQRQDRIPCRSASSPRMTEAKCGGQRLRVRAGDAACGGASPTSASGPQRTGPLRQRVQVVHTENLQRSICIPAHNVSGRVTRSAAASGSWNQVGQGGTHGWMLHESMEAGVMYHYFFVFVSCAMARHRIPECHNRRTGLGVLGA